MIAQLNKDFRVTLPKELRKILDLKPGMKFDCSAENNSIKFFPLKSKPNKQ